MDGLKSSMEDANTFYIAFVEHRKRVNIIMACLFFLREEFAM